MPNKDADEDEKTQRRASYASLLMTTSSIQLQRGEKSPESPASEKDEKDEPPQKERAGSPRSKDGGDQNQNQNSLLSNDFVLMLDCSPSLEETFCENSPEFGVAWLWFDKLTTTRCSTLNDLRMRNAYMSHFIVCLNQRRLSGVFEQPPPKEELTWVNFLENNSTQQSTTAGNLLQRSCDHNQSARAAPTSTSSCCCSGQRTTSEYWGSLPENRSPGGTSALDSKSPAPRRRHLLRQVPTTSEEEVRQLYRNNRTNARFQLSSASGQSTNRSLSPSAPKFPPRRNAFRCSDCQRIPQEARQRMLDLMDLIRKELRGEPDAKKADVLEAEVQRYRQFFEQHMQDNSDFGSHLSVDSNSERIRLLLNMQTDLIRMLKEDI